MTLWIWILGAVYAAMLIAASLRSYKKGRTAEDFMLAGSNVGMILGVLTFAAALFSTFTFLGMPDFFRVNGVGAWIFLALSDGAMVFFILWFGYHIRMKVKQKGFRGVAGLLSHSYGSRWAGYVIFLSAFLFLIPYVGIQVQGIAIFMNAAFPGSLPAWAWSAAIIVVMLIYSEIGGFKAIIYSDAIQGLLLLIVIWIIGIACLGHFGGIREMFATIEKTNVKLLSTPGPEGLFTPQFLLASLLVIILIPVTQPQFTTRIVVMKSMKTMHLMALAVGVFAILVITPTLFIGFYGADKYPGIGRDAFFAKAFLYDRSPFVAALAVIGLIAAGLSTTNAQIFALGSELRGLMHGDERKVMIRTRAGIFIFSLVALGFSLVISDQIALLARVSFTGTGMMGPLIILGILSDRKISPLMIWLSLIALLIFVLSLAGFVPQVIAGLRLDLILLGLLGLFAVFFHITGERTPYPKKNRKV